MRFCPFENSGIRFSISTSKLLFIDCSVPPTHCDFLQSNYIPQTTFCQVILHTFSRSYSFLHCFPELKIFLDAHNETLPQGSTNIRHCKPSPERCFTLPYIPTLSIWTNWTKNNFYKLNFFTSQIRHLLFTNKRECGIILSEPDQLMSADARS